MIKKLKQRIKISVLLCVLCGEKISTTENTERRRGRCFMMNRLKNRIKLLRKMSRKWASCSSKGRLTFSYELLTKSKEERAKVIVHELLHLKYKSHNKFFKNLLAAHLAKKGMCADSIKL
ncbi:MAG: M48 family metallopeptidase [Spirochaetota bacterium]